MDEQAVGVVTGEVSVSEVLTTVQDGAPIRPFYEVLAEIVSALGSGRTCRIARPT